MSTIAIDTSQLQYLIRSAVNEAFNERMDELRSDWDDELTDAALARAMDDARNSPRMSVEEFHKRLQTSL